MELSLSLLIDVLVPLLLAIKLLLILVKLLLLPPHANNSRPPLSPSPYEWLTLRRKVLLLMVF
jgi:hypothetical protein